MNAPSAESSGQPSIPATLDTTRTGEHVIRVVVESAQNQRASRWSRLLLFALMFSLLLNFSLFSAYSTYFQEFEGPTERYHSGSKEARKKIAILTLQATIMPPFTERFLEQIKKAREDADVQGVVLVVDSPGGLVADSHQIYHQLTLLAEKKPIYVQMKRIAASGGYYISMAAGKQGKIFAEPTTWTGSIGVIIPHYDFTNLAEKVGVQSAPLTTGEFKDSLSSFKPLSDREREVWTGILDESFQRFLSIIAAGRPKLSREQIEGVATGRIFTADQALAEGLIDEIGYLEQTVEKLQAQLKLEEARVIEYAHPPSLSDYLLGVTSPSRSELSLLQELFNSPSPRAFYLMGQGN